MYNMDSVGFDLSHFLKKQLCEVGDSSNPLKSFFCTVDLSKRFCTVHPTLRADGYAEKDVRETGKYCHRLSLPVTVSECKFPTEQLCFFRKHKTSHSSAKPTPSHSLLLNQADMFETPIRLCFALGYKPMPPLIIFRGQQCPSKKEEAMYDRKVIVVWQPKAWFDRKVSMEYVREFRWRQPDRPKVCNSFTC